MFVSVRKFLFPLIVFSTVTVFGQSKLGLELSYLGTSGSVDLPGALSDRFEKVEGGAGSAISLGLIIRANEKVRFIGGFKQWNMPFMPTVIGTFNGNSARLKEKAILSYTGIYLRLERTWSYFYLSGGFDFSLSNSYNGEVEIRSETGTLLSKQENLTRSSLTSDFYNQSNLFLGLGPQIPLGKHFSMKGNISIALALSSIYDSGVSIQQIYINTGKPAPNAEVNLQYLPFVSYGLTLAYNF